MKRGGGPVTKKHRAYPLVRAKGHPLATSGHVAYLHRMILYDRIGPGTHPCHWCGTPVTWRAPLPHTLEADHLDGNTANLHPANLVPACRPCNAGRVGQRPGATPAAPTWTPSRNW